MSSEDIALQRLRDPAGDHLDRLARMVVEDATATPLREVAAPRWIASQLATGLEAATRGDALRGFVERRLEESRERLADEERPVREWVPDEVDEPLRKLLAHPWTPSEDLTLRVIDQGVFHELLKEVLENSLRRFSSRLRRFDQDKLGGVGKKLKGVGRGLFGNLADGLGGAAESLVGSVSNEFEGAIERRIDEFLAGATHEAMSIVVRHACNPDNAEAYGEVRTQVLDVLLDAPIGELYGEFDKMQPLEGVDVIVSALRATVARDDFVDETEQRVASLIEGAGDGTLGAWLDEVGLREVWTDTTTELITARLEGVVKTADFEQWWSDLHRAP